MRRFFNTTGLCNPQHHYMVDPFRDLYSDVLRLIESQQYFLIHAPRQTGKTTFLHALAHRLNLEGDYVSVVCSLESAGYPSISVESANEVFIRSLYRMSGFFLAKKYLPPDPSTYTSGNSLSAFTDFYRWNSESWLERFQYKEAGHQLLLMAFLQRIINGGGRIEREMAVGNGRTDLAVFWKNQVIPIEIKMHHDARSQSQGLQQLSRYMDKLGQKQG